MSSSSSNKEVPVRRVAAAELVTLLSDRLVANDEAAFGEEILDIPQAGAEPTAEPDGVSDNLAHDVWTAAAQDCRGCGVQPSCCPGIDLRKQGRSVSVSVPHPAVEAFDEKMQRPAAQAIYQKRAPLAEFPNASIKQKLKLRRFATRGLAKVKCEALWAALTFKLQRLFGLSLELVPGG